MTRITQQDRLYEAERCMPLALRGPVFESIDELRRWVIDIMLDADWWRERFHAVRGVDVMASRRPGQSVGGHIVNGVGHIDMAREHWCGLYTCHEMAHVVGETVGSVSHDPIFASIYLELVYRLLGEASWTELRNLFLRHRVCFDERCLARLACQCSVPRFDPDPMFSGTFAAQRETY